MEVFNFEDETGESRARQGSVASVNTYGARGRQGSTASVTNALRDLDSLDLHDHLEPDYSTHTGAVAKPIPIKPNTGTSGKRYPESGSYEIGINSDFVSSDTKRLLTPRPEDFDPLKVLGVGAYGKVLLVRERSTGRLYAQKQLKKASMIVEKKRVEQTQTEKTILESVRHPYIVKLFYALQDHQKLYLVLEFAQGGELFSHLAQERMFPEKTAAFYVAQMALALHHLHENVGVVYRDLKPENCLLDAQGHLLLADFGLSKVAQGDKRCRSILGTPEYMAPEVLKGLDYDYAVDWWSLGAVCYDLITGSPPYRGSSYAKILAKIDSMDKPRLPYYLSPDAKHLLTGLLRKDPKQRLSCKDLATIKAHRFFRHLDWDLLQVRSPLLKPSIRPIVTDPELAENFSTEFTEMSLSPSESCAPSMSHNFHGFSFTASSTFIERAFEST